VPRLWGEEQQVTDEPTGQELKDEGMARVKAKENEIDPTFLADGLEQYAIFHYLTVGTYTSEDVRDAIGREPHAPQCWSALAGAAYRADLINHVGYDKMKKPSSHESETRVYMGCGTTNVSNDTARLDAWLHTHWEAVRLKRQKAMDKAVRRLIKMIDR